MEVGDKINMDSAIIIAAVLLVLIAGVFCICTYYSLFFELHVGNRTLMVNGSEINKDIDSSISNVSIKAGSQ